jgi:hypothetical protein
MESEKFSIITTQLTLFLYTNLGTKLALLRNTVLIFNFFLLASGQLEVLHQAIETSGSTVLFVLPVCHSSEKSTQLTHLLAPWLALVSSGLPAPRLLLVSVLP